MVKMLGSLLQMLLSHLRPLWSNSRDTKDWDSGYHYTECYLQSGSPQPVFREGSVLVLYLFIREMNKRWSVASHKNSDYLILNCCI